MTPQSKRYGVGLTNIGNHVLDAVGVAHEITDETPDGRWVETSTGMVDLDEGWELVGQPVPERY